MRALVQRVNCASVVVDNQIISEIGKGICVLVGFSKYDQNKDVDYMVRKLLNLRIFDDQDGKRWMCSVKNKNYQVLCVSQFTLYSMLKGNKPDFHQSMAPEVSQSLYEDFVEKMKINYSPEMVKEGKFRTKCQVKIENDGPVTMMLESPNDTKDDSNIHR